MHCVFVFVWLWIIYIVLYWIYCIPDLVKMLEDLESHFKEVQSLNLTTRVRHIVDGESDIIPDDDDIPSPINHTNITNNDTQEDVGEVQHNVGSTPDLGNDSHMKKTTWEICHQQGKKMKEQVVNPQRAKRSEKF